MSLALRLYRFPPTRVKPPVPTTTGLPPTPPPIPESTIERLIKLIPADVVAIYIPALGLAELVHWPSYRLAVSLGGLVLVPLLLYLDADAANERVPPLQYVIRTLAFAAWALLIGQPFGAGAVNPVISALVALVLPVLGERLLRARPTA
ncbi:MAG: hypothetical protein H7138_01140 [Myxococcales bacterium]|nr:hypothetical protein [Myxococcales bacterium]